MTPNDYMKYTNLLFGSDNEWIVHVRNCKSYNYYYSRVLLKNKVIGLSQHPSNLTICKGIHMPFFSLGANQSNILGN